jgi:hypothetical protein
MAQKKEQQAAVPQAGTTTVLSFGCLGGVCVATDSYPLHSGPPGSQLYMCALNSGVDIKFTGNSPFVSGKKIFSISMGTCTPPEIVAASNPGTKFKFTLGCTAGCPTPAAAPEMIVP